MDLAETPIRAAVDSSLGWTQTWVYYTSYVEFWKMSVPNAHVLYAMLKNNFLMLLSATGDYFLAPTLSHNTPIGRVIITLVTATALGGIIRQARRQEWQPIHYALLFSVSVILCWNFADVNRFLLPFLPLLASGVWIEGKLILGMIRRAISRSGCAGEKIVALALGAGVLATSLVIGLNYVVGTREISNQSQYRGTLLLEKREAYDWLVRFAPRNARVIAYEDSSSYLYTSIPTLTPLAFTTAEFYDHEQFERSLAHMGDVATAIGASYWLFSDDDFDFVWPDATIKARACLASIERGLPVAFRSLRGRVRVHPFSPVQIPKILSCGSAH